MFNIASNSILSLLKMDGFNISKKKWYSVCYCEQLNLNLTKQKDFINDLNDTNKKFVFIQKSKSKDFIKYELNRKTWIKVDSYEETKGIIQRRIPIIKKTNFNHYETIKLIIFHTGISKIRMIIRYINNESKSKLIILKNIDLKLFLKELKNLRVCFK